MIQIARCMRAASKDVRYARFYWRAHSRAQRRVFAERRAICTSFQQIAPKAVRIADSTATNHINLLFNKMIVF